MYCLPNSQINLGILILQHFENNDNKPEYNM